MGSITQFFNLSKGERYGFWVLVALIVIGMTLPQFIEKQTEPAYKANQEIYEKQIQQFMAASKASDKQTSTTSESSPQPVQKISYFHFNPNEISFDSLLQLGMPEKLAHTIINYRQAGGRFHSKNDLKAIYGMPDSTYNRLKPYVSLPKENQGKSYKANATPKTKDSNLASNDKKPSFSKGDEEEVTATNTQVSLNEADSASLTKVRGIGDFFAGEIVSRREKLGGYRNYRQLLAIYNFDSSALKRVKPQLSLNPSKIQKLSLNNSDFETLLSHPNLDYPQVKAIFNYKDRVDTIGSVEELKKERILGSGPFKEIKPYLKP